MHVGIFGLAGAGKTTVAKCLARENINYVAISASKLIEEYGGVIEYERLEGRVISSNQDSLVMAYSNFKRVHENTLIELHSVIESESSVTDVDVRILQELDLNAAFFIKVEPHELGRRRRLDTTKKRKQVFDDELEILQLRAIDVCRKALGSKLRVVDSVIALAVIEEFIKSVPAE
ncbi:AAA family ATPase [Pseudomonas inefficax]|uniref:AAA family ATPase n=1 Tax=Pseudomonas inefficax TaxID=2078786 RepID=UPI003266548E